MRLRARTHLTVVAAVGALALLGPGVALATNQTDAPATVAASATDLPAPDATGAPQLSAPAAGAPAAGAPVASAEPTEKQAASGAAAVDPAAEPAAEPAADPAAEPKRTRRQRTPILTPEPFHLPQPHTNRMPTTSRDHST